jgi:hypothetical protein
MMSFYLSGGVEVLGFISPTEPTDEYPVIDPLYGIDGFRNVNTLSDLNSIPNLRRRAGMVVGVSGGTQYYKLNPSPWNGSITDWSIFNSGSGGGAFTGGTVTGDTIFTQGVTATTFSASTYLGLPLDVYVTGGTYSNGTITFLNNSGGTFDVTGLYTGETSYINSLTTGVGLSGNTTTGNITLINTAPDQTVTISGGTNVDVTGSYPNFIIDVTGVTSSDKYVTGGTFNKNTEILTLNRNDGNDVQVTGFTDIYTTGFTFDTSTYDISIELNDGTTLTQSLYVLASDVTITGGTYDQSNGSITFVNNTGGTFTVSGFITGFTDVQVTGYTYQDNTFTISDSSGNTFSTTINSVTGLTINGDLTVTGNTVFDSLSASTYLGLPLDIYVTGGTYSAGTITFVNNSGDTFDVVGLYTGETSYVNSLTTGVGLSANTTTGNINIINTDPDQIVTISGGTGIMTGGTYPNFTIENTLPDQTVVLNNGSNISVTGTYPNFTIDVTGLTDNNTYTTGFTYNNNTFTIKDNSGSTFNATINSVTGLTVNGDLIVTGNTSLQVLSATTINANTYYGDGSNLTGISRGGGSGQLYYFNISNTQTPYYEFSTTATTTTEQTISATTGANSTVYVGGFMTPLNVPNITNIPAGILSFYLHAYDGGTNHSFDIYCELYKRTTGGTETLLFTSDPASVLGNTPTMMISDGFFSGTTVNSSDRLVVKVYGTNLTNQTRTIYFVSEGSSHYSFALTTIPSFTDTYVTGFTYNNNTFTISQTTGSPLLATINMVTGLTVNGNLITTSISASTYQNLPLDVYVTGGTYSNGTITFRNNSGNTFNVTGLYTGETSYVNSLTTGTGLSANTTTGNVTLINTAPDQTVTISGGTGILTGGTYPNFTITNTSPDKTVVLNNGSNISVTGTYPNFTVGVTGLTDNDRYTTGFTYNNNTFTISDNSGSTFNATINTVTGLTVNGNLTVTGNTSLQALTATTISATTYQNLPTDIRVTGATYSNNTFTFTNNTGGTFNTSFNTVTGLTVNGNLTVTGNTSLQGLTATTISAATYQNITVPSGVYGISNSSGVYTYYSTLALAMAAASSGQVVEMFADVTETSGTAVDIKPNVTIQGNGHTYTHTSTTGNTFTLSTTGTYRFMNMIIKRTVTTPTGAYIFNNTGAPFYQGYTMVFQNTSVEYTWTTSVGATPFIAPSTNVCTYYIDGLRALANGSGYMFGGGLQYIQTIKNSIIENTGTGSCFTSDNITGGSFIENSHLKTNSGTAVAFNYTGQGDAIRNSTVISTSGIGVSGGYAYDTSSFSSTNRAFSGVICYSCAGSTASGTVFYQCTAFNTTGISSTGYVVVPFFTLSSFYNCSFNAVSNIVAYDATYSAAFYNCTITSGYNNAAGHGISLANVGNVVVNCYISVTNTSANCFKGTSAITAKYSNNVFAGATTPVNSNVTQSITNTQDNQGNILI